MSGGRPTTYSPEVTAAICERITEGQSLRTICADDDMPAKSTVLLWLQKHKEFSDQYARACEARTDAHAEEIIAIADDGANDWMQKHHGDDVRWVENGEAIRRSQLRIDARKWLMGKHAPKKYGDKIQQELSGPDGKPVEIATVERRIVYPKD